MIFEKKIITTWKIFFLTKNVGIKKEFNSINVFYIGER